MNKFICLSMFVAFLAFSSAFVTENTNQVVKQGENILVGGNLFVCIDDHIQEFADLVQLGFDLLNHAYWGVAKDVFNIAELVYDKSVDCQGFFCFGPSYDKCREDHPGNFCEQWGLIIYPCCDEGFTNWDCCVCATVCPDGFRDDGLYCAKPSSYGRGAGYAIWNEDKCKKEHPDTGCEKSGAMYYPKCKEGFHAVGCCVCSPNCPSGWTDIGVSCKKPESYGRGVGYAVSMNCGDHYDNKHLDRPTIANDSCDNQRELMHNLLVEVDEKLKSIHGDPASAQDDPNFTNKTKELEERVKKFFNECYQQ